MVFDENIIETAKSYGVIAKKEYKKQEPNLEAANIIKNVKLLASEKYEEVSDTVRAQKNRRYLKKMGIVVESEPVESEQVESESRDATKKTQSWADWLKG